MSSPINYPAYIMLHDIKKMTIADFEMTVYRQPPPKILRPSYGPEVVERGTD